VIVGQPTVMDERRTIRLPAGATVAELPPSVEIDSPFVRLELTVERLPGVFEAGADVAAVVNDIVSNPNPESRAREWLATASRYGD